MARRVEMDKRCHELEDLERTLKQKARALKEQLPARQADLERAKAAQRTKERECKAEVCALQLLPRSFV